MVDDHQRAEAGERRRIRNGAGVHRTDRRVLGDRDLDAVAKNRGAEPVGAVPPEARQHAPSAGQSSAPLKGSSGSITAAPLGSAETDRCNSVWAFCRSPM